MTDPNQVVVPRSFVELFIPPHGIRPTESREHIAERHEFCEDLALSLVEHPELRSQESRDDALALVHRGLLADASLLSPAEVEWVVKRLEEILVHGTP